MIGKRIYKRSKYDDRKMSIDEFVADNFVHYDDPHSTWAVESICNGFSRLLFTLKENGKLTKAEVEFIVTGIAHE